MARAASGDLPLYELRPFGLDIGERTKGRALHLGDGLANLPKDDFLVVFWHEGPCSAAQNTFKSRDREIRPTVSFTFQHNPGNIDIKTSLELDERSALRLELTTIKRWEYFED